MTNPEQPAKDLTEPVPAILSDRQCGGIGSEWIGAGTISLSRIGESTRGRDYSGIAGWQGNDLYHPFPITIRLMEVA